MSQTTQPNPTPPPNPLHAAVDSLKSDGFTNLTSLLRLADAAEERLTQLFTPERGCMQYFETLDRSVMTIARLTAVRRSLIQLRLALEHPELFLAPIGLPVTVQSSFAASPAEVLAEVQNDLQAVEKNQKKSGPVTPSTPSTTSTPSTPTAPPTPQSPPLAAAASDSPSGPLCPLGPLGPSPSPIGPMGPIGPINSTSSGSTSSGPKGQNIIAQPNGLGLDAENSQALKGRNNNPLSPTEIFRAAQLRLHSLSPSNILNPSSILDPFTIATNFLTANFPDDSRDAEFSVNSDRHAGDMPALFPSSFSVSKNSMAHSAFRVSHAHLPSVPLRPAALAAALLDLNRTIHAIPNMHYREDPNQPPLLPFPSPVDRQRHAAGAPPLSERAAQLYANGAEWNSSSSNTSAHSAPSAVKDSSLPIFPTGQYTPRKSRIRNPQSDIDDDDDSDFFAPGYDPKIHNDPNLDPKLPNYNKYRRPPPDGPVRELKIKRRKRTPP